MQTEIEIVVSPQGDTSVEVKNLVGASCTDLTKQLESDLGITAKDHKKSEYFQTQTREAINERR